MHVLAVSRQLFLFLQFLEDSGSGKCIFSGSNLMCSFGFNSRATIGASPRPLGPSDQNQICTFYTFNDVCLYQFAFALPKDFSTDSQITFEEKGDMH